MKSPLERKVIRKSEFESLGLELLEEHANGYILLGKGKGRYILQKEVPNGALEPLDTLYHQVDYYEVQGE